MYAFLAAVNVREQKFRFEPADLDPILPLAAHLTALEHDGALTAGSASGHGGRHALCV
jgi:hypothetical protein